MLQVYATADVGLIAYESSAQEGMIIEESIIVEIVRPGTADLVADGEVGEVLVSTLDPHYPLIRFATGALSTFMAGESPCGRTNRRVLGWMGRADQTAKVRGLFVHPSQVAEMIARQGCFAVIIGGGGHTRGNPKVAPYGGREGIMGTNPYTLALPGGPTGVVVVDFATSTSAQGKLLAASKTGEPLPPGTILDRDGRPSIDARDYYAGGVLLPAAGPKGYGLGLIGELLAHGVLGQARALNWLVLAVDLDLLSDDDYGSRIDDYLEWVKGRAPAEGFDEVMIPGEPEQRCRQLRKNAGIPIADEIWEEIIEWATRMGIMLSDIDVNSNSHRSQVP